MVALIAKQDDRGAAAKRNEIAGAPSRAAEAHQADQQSLVGEDDRHGIERGRFASCLVCTPITVNLKKAILIKNGYNTSKPDGMMSRKINNVIVRLP